MAKNKKGFVKEFKEFITKGNVVDLAVGVIIGGAFTAIVTALTTNILQPLINWVLSLVISKDALAGARFVLGEAVYMLNDAGESVIDWTSTNYIDLGAFISAIINFFLVAIVLFLIVKIINRARSAADKLKEAELEKYYEKHPNERPAPVVPGVPKPTEAELLTEIRDMLKKNKK